MIMPTSNLCMDFESNITNNITGTSRDQDVQTRMIVPRMATLAPSPASNSHHKSRAAPPGHCTTLTTRRTKTGSNYRPFTTYINTLSASNVQRTIHRLQFDRYQRRGEKASTASTSHSTAPILPTFNQVTPIVNGSIAPSLAPTTLSEKQPTIMTNGSATLITAQTHNCSNDSPLHLPQSHHSLPPSCIARLHPTRISIGIETPNALSLFRRLTGPRLYPQRGSHIHIRPGYPYTGKK